jgi:hypothetical protein
VKGGKMVMSKWKRIAALLLSSALIFSCVSNMSGIKVLPQKGPRIAIAAKNILVEIPEPQKKAVNRGEEIAFEVIEHKIDLQVFKDQASDDRRKVENTLEIPNIVPVLKGVLNEKGKSTPVKDFPGGMFIIIFLDADEMEMLTGSNEKPDSIVFGNYTPDTKSWAIIRLTLNAQPTRLDDRASNLKIQDLVFRESKNIPAKTPEGRQLAEKLSKEGETMYIISMVVLSWSPEDPPIILGGP